MLNIFFTIDTEVWPVSLGRDLSERSFATAYQRDILGRTRSGDFGLPLHLKILHDHGIRATFFVESLFASRFGIQVLADIVEPVMDGGHEVQMHLHPEWAQTIPDLEHLFVEANGSFELSDYSEEAQFRMMELGLENLLRAGVVKPRAFRAGNFSAGLATLRAVRRLGLEFDSSYNYCYLGTRNNLRTAEALQQPTMLEGLLELPVTHFQDWPGHYRHAQLTACSFSELSTMLDQACEQGRSTFVIVSHSFELLNPTRCAPDPIVRRRFERLCRYIVANSDRMRVQRFNDLDIDSLKPEAALQPLESSVPRTAMRYAMQILRRLPRRSQFA